MSLLIKDFDLEGANRAADYAFQAGQELLHNEGLLRGLNLWDVVVHAGAGAFERLVVVESPEDYDRNHTGHRLALDLNVVIPHMDAGRTRKPGGPLRRGRFDLVGALLTFLHHLVRAVRPAAFENL